jgi:release factor glutamine methyltransferase
MKKQEYIDIGLTAGLTSSQIESVLCRVMNISREELFKLSEISSTFIYEVQQVFFKLQSGASEEYTLEKANFYGRDFFVDERVLIPRNDTELLVKIALEKLHSEIQIKNMLYFDVGTGSGCIPITIVLEMHPLKFKKVVALEFSEDAIDVAAENIEKLAPGKMELRESNLLSGVFYDEDITWKSLCITANLPYIKDGDFKNMDAQVVRNEPNRALYGWAETGFELYEALIKQCFQMKQVHKLWEIHLFIEIGFDQKKHSQKYLRELWLWFEYFTDSSNIERVIYIKDF